MPNDTPRPLVVRAKRAVLRTYVFGFLAVSIPVFGVLYWYAIPLDSWRPVLAMQLAFLIIFAIGVWRVLSIYTRVTAIDVSGRGFLVPQRSIPLDSIDRVVLVPVYFGGAHERTTQFLALDADGKALVRLRGQYWNRVDLDRVADAIGKPVSTETVPLSDAEFFAEYPRSKYWFERNLLASIGIVAVAAIGIFALTGAMLLITGLR